MSISLCAEPLGQPILKGGMCGATLKLRHQWNGLIGKARFAILAAEN